MASFWEKVQVDRQDMDVYASVPSGSGPFPAVVVCAHGGGVDEFIRTICDRLAEAGYAGVAPDLFHRITEEMVQSSGLSRRELLSDPQTIADIDATVDWLRNHAAIDGARLGITGFCMGGREAWVGAATNPHIKAAVPYYGGNIQAPWGEAAQSPFELAGGIKCPVLFHFGEIDVNPSQDDMGKYDAEFTRLGISHQFYTYPDTNHGFMDFTAERYKKESADASWPRTLDFFAQHLQGAPVSR
jgi:carboxymethylenebutenolidase